jgi:hypothetical protein
MERGRESSQAFANEIKEKPGCDKAGHKLSERERAGESAPAQQGHTRELCEASRAHDAVVVFAHAFAAVEIPAPRAARHRFALCVVKASLVGEVGHQEAGSDVPTAPPAVSAELLAAGVEDPVAAGSD